MNIYRFFILIGTTIACQINVARAQPRTELNLYDAIRTDQPEAVDSFLSRGGDPNSAILNSPMGNVPPLRVAVAAKREAVSLALLRAGARMDIAGVALGDLSAAGMDEALQHVLAEQQPTDLTVIKGALEVSVTLGHYDSVDVLLSYIKEKNLPVRPLLQNAIHSAIGKDDIARLLLENGAPVNGGVLRAAATWSSPGMMRYLLQLGADPFEPYHETSTLARQEGFTAIEFVWDAYLEGTESQRRAATFKLFDLLLLGNTSARVDATVAVDGSALLARISNPSERLRVAAELGFYDTVSEVLSGSISLDPRVLNEATSAALRSHWDDIARLLLQAGASPNDGPLHIAVRNSSPGMVRFLLKLGADPNELRDGYTPVEFWFRSDPSARPARSSTNPDVLHELIMGGANVCDLVNYRDELIEQPFSYDVLWNSAPGCWPEQR